MWLKDRLRPFGTPSQSIDVDRDDVNKYAVGICATAWECTEIILAVDGDGNGQVRDDLAVRLGRTAASSCGILEGMQGFE